MSNTKQLLQTLLQKGIQMWTSADDNAAKAFESNMTDEAAQLLEVLEVALRGASGLSKLSLIEICKPWLERQLKLQPELKHHETVAAVIVEKPEEINYW